MDEVAEGTGQFEHTAGCLGVLIFGFIVVVSVLIGVSSLDSHGLIAHTDEAQVTAEINWFIGESKTCHSTPLDKDAALAVGKNYGNAVSLFACDSGPTHDVKVTFYGRRDQPEYGTVFWRCTRNENGFTCAETAGYAFR